MRGSLCVILFLLSANAFAQDSLVVKAIDAATSKNYDRINRTDWYLTRDLVVADSGPSGTQVSYHYDNNELIRIVCSGYNKLGQWGKEYYPVDGDLAFIYMSQEYFPDQAKPGMPVSWKNLPTHEYRLYIKKGKLVRSDPEGWTGTIADLQKEFDSLQKWKK